VAVLAARTPPISTLNFIIPAHHQSTRIIGRRPVSHETPSSLQSYTFFFFFFLFCHSISFFVLLHSTKRLFRLGLCAILGSQLHGMTSPIVTLPTLPLSRLVAIMHVLLSLCLIGPETSSAPSDTQPSATTAGGCPQKTPILCLLLGFAWRTLLCNPSVLSELATARYLPATRPCWPPPNVAPPAARLGPAGSTRFSRTSVSDIPK
jgi:hypothetical protein